MTENKGLEIHYQDKPIKCPICGNTRFTSQSALIAPRWIGVPFVATQAKCYICMECQYVLWFSEE